jgi:hypothetical protein
MELKGEWSLREVEDVDACRQTEHCTNNAISRTVSTSVRGPPTEDGHFAYHQFSDTIHDTAL